MRKPRGLRATDSIEGKRGLSEIAYAPEAQQDLEPVAAGRPIVRRQWGDDEKRQLVWEGLNSGKSLSLFAKSRGIHPSVMHRWLCAFTRPALTDTLPNVTAFAEVRVAETLPATAPVIPRGPAAPISAGVIEIELLSGRRIRLCGEVDPDTLRRLVAVLESPA